MATSGQNYAVGIGTGAAGGAASGAAFGPWGALIGAGIGAAGGAISAGVANSKEADEKRRMLAAQQRSRHDILLDLQRNYAARNGVDTTYLDTLRALKGEDLQNASQDAQFAAQHRIDPASFVPIAQLGTQAAGRVYSGLKAPQSPYGMPGQDFGRPTQDASPAYSGTDVGSMLPMQQAPVGGQLVPADEQQDWLRSLA